MLLDRTGTAGNGAGQAGAGHFLGGAVKKGEPAPKRDQTRGISKREANALCLVYGTICYESIFFLVKILNPRTGRGGKFCPPLKFFEDITKTYGLILTSFSVPDQN